MHGDGAPGRWERSFGDTEAVDAGVLVGLARAEDGGGEGRVVGAVREVLGFEAEGSAAGVGAAVAALVFFFEVIGGVELDGGFGGEALERAAGDRVFDFGGGAEFASGAVDDEVVVVALAVLDREEVGFVDAVADAGRFEEVERGAGDGEDLACGDESGVGVGVGTAGHFEDVVEDGAVAVTCEVEVGVVGEVDDGGSVGGCGVDDGEFVAVVEGVGDLAVEFAGVVFFAVGAGVGEDEGGGAVFEDGGFDGPEFFVEAFFAAVETVGAVIDGEEVGGAVEGEFSFGDAVGVAAGEAAEERVAGFVFSDGVFAEDDAVEFARAVGDIDADDDATEVGDTDGSAVFGGEGVEADGAAVFEIAEGFFGDGGLAHSERGGEEERGEGWEELFHGFWSGGVRGDEMRIRPGVGKLKSLRGENPWKRRNYGWRRGGIPR